MCILLPIDVIYVGWKVITGLVLVIKKFFDIRILIIALKKVGLPGSLTGLSKICRTLVSKEINECCLNFRRESIFGLVWRQEPRKWPFCPSAGARPHFFCFSQPSEGRTLNISVCSVCVCVCEKKVKVFCADYYHFLNIKINIFFFSQCWNCRAGGNYALSLTLVVEENTSAATTSAVSQLSIWLVLTFHHHNNKEEDKLLVIFTKGYIYHHIGSSRFILWKTIFTGKFFFFRK